MRLNAIVACGKRDANEGVASVAIGINHRRSHAVNAVGNRTSRVPMRVGAWLPASMGSRVDRSYKTTRLEPGARPRACDDVQIGRVPGSPSRPLGRVLQAPARADSSRPPLAILSPTRRRRRRRRHSLQDAAGSPPMPAGSRLKLACWEAGLLGSAQQLPAARASRLGCAACRPGRLHPPSASPASGPSPRRAAGC